MIGLLLLVSAGLIEVQADYGTTISIDRQPRGQAPLPPLPVSAGLHLVEVHRAGRPGWRRLVFVAPGQRVVLEVRLPTEREAPAAAPASPARPASTRVRGVVVGVATQLATRADVDLDQQWRLDHRLSEDAHLHLDLTATTDLAGDRTFERGPLRSTAPGDRTRLVLQEARADVRDQAWRLAGGRLRLAGPTQATLGLDGAQLELPLGALTAQLRAGRRFEPVVLRPVGFVAGLGGRWQQGGLVLAAHYLGGGPHLVDAEATWSDAGWHLEGGATTADTTLIATRARITRRGGVLATLEHRRRGQGELQPELPAIDRLPPLASPTHQARLVVEAVGLRTEVAGRWPDQAAVTQPRVIQGEIHARLPHALGVRLDTLLAGPADLPGSLAAYARLAATAHPRFGRAELAAELGLGALDLRDATGARRTHLRPEGRVGLRLPLTEPLVVTLEGAAESVHPVWSPDGAPLLTALLGLALR